MGTTMIRYLGFVRWHVVKQPSYYGLILTVPVNYTRPSTTAYASSDDYDGIYIVGETYYTFVWIKVFPVHKWPYIGLLLKNRWYPMEVIKEIANCWLMGDVQYGCISDAHPRNIRVYLYFLLKSIRHNLLNYKNKFSTPGWQEAVPSASWWRLCKKDCQFGKNTGMW